MEKFDEENARNKIHCCIVGHSPIRTRAQGAWTLESVTFPMCD